MLTNQSDWDAVLKGSNGSPLPSSFLASRVPNLGHEGLVVGVFVLEDVARDFNKE